MSEEQPQTEIEQISSEITMSAEIGKLAEALSKAQGAMKGASKNKSNSFYKSDYSDLDSSWEACREQLSKNNLSVAQCHRQSDKGNLILDTLLLHSSGQWLKGTLEVRPTKNDPQMIVSASTYARRAGLQAMVGIAPTDDDGNAASGKTAEPQRPRASNKGKNKDKPSSKGKQETNAKQQEQPVDGVSDEDDDF